MTPKIFTHTTQNGQHLQIGPRVIADCKRRVRELEVRPAGAMTATNRRELTKLKEFLRLIKTDGSPNGGTGG